MLRERIDPARLGSRLATLTYRHRAVDAEIKVELARPLPDAGVLQCLKRQRLRLKEQIARTAQSAGRTADLAS